MGAFIDEAMEVVDFLRIAGVRDFVKGIVAACKKPERVMYRDFMVLPRGEGTFANMRKAACRALGLPDDWRYNEAELRKTRSNDALERCHAIDVLMGSEKKRLRDARNMQPLELLTLSQKLLPGARLLIAAEHEPRAGSDNGMEI